MKSSLLVIGILVLSASTSEAQKKGRRPPVTTVYAEVSGVVFRDCDVNPQAELKAPYPKFEAPARADGSQMCYTAWFEFVVDTNGHVVESTAKLVRTNNRFWADEVKRHLSEARFEPAQKNDKRVQQLVRFRPSLARSNAGPSLFSPGAQGATPIC